MKPRLHALAACLLLGLAGSVAAAPRTVTDPAAPRMLAPSASPVQVSWTDPSQFSEIRHSFNRWEAARGNWVMQLAEYLHERAERALPPGERLEVVVTDIERAGDFEPWGGTQLRDARIVRDIYPPRLSLQFTRYDASGAVLDQGERKLSDMGYLSRSNTHFDSDALRYEKQLIDDWIRKDLGTARD